MVTTTLSMDVHSMCLVISPNRRLQLVFCCCVQGPGELELNGRRDLRAHTAGRYSHVSYTYYRILGYRITQCLFTCYFRCCCYAMTQRRFKDQVRRSSSNKDVYRSVNAHFNLCHARTVRYVSSWPRSEVEDL